LVYSDNWVVACVDISIEGLRIGRPSRCQQRIHCRESAEAVFVHSGFGEVEAGFFVVLVAGEFLADVVLVGGVFEAGVARAAADARVKLLAKGHKVPPGLHLPKLVRDDPRRAQMIRRRVCNARRLRKLRRILRNELPGGIDEDGRLGVGFLLDAFAFTVIEIPADGYAIAFNFRLLIIAVEDELPGERSERINIRNDVAVRVVA